MTTSSGADQPRDRTRRLADLNLALSRAVASQDVIATMIDAGRSAIGAAAGFAWILNRDGTLELAGRNDDARRKDIASFQRITLDANLPVCDVIRTGEPMMFESREAMNARYPSSAESSPFSAWVLVPLIVDARCIGAASFSFDNPRTFGADDRELLAAMGGQASLALDRAMVIDSERRARHRERQLHALAARLSSALTQQQIAVIASEESASVLGAYSATMSIRVGDEVHVIGSSGGYDPALVARHEVLAIDARFPHVDAIRTSQIVWCASTAELEQAYPHLESIWRARGIEAWGAVPLAFEGRTIGALAAGSRVPRALTADDRDFWQAFSQLVAQALERARLFDALKTNEEQLRSALSAARAATWTLDIETMRSVRDPSYLALVGISDARVDANFMSIHPDDRAIAQRAYERTLREDVAYEPEVRIRRDDGTYMWIRAHARLVRDASGIAKTLAGVIVDIDEFKRASLRAEEDRRVNEMMQRLVGSFATVLDHDRLVQLMIDELTKLVGAETGAFLTDATLSRELVRLDDANRPSARSYLEVPVIASTGDLHGSLVFAHAEPGRFTEQHATLAASIASQAAVALENARLYKSVREHEDHLEQAVERARIADRRKDEFLAMLGHELRNPLAPIATALDLMELKGGQSSHECEVIRRQVEHLSRLIDDLLDVSRITRGKIQLSRAIVDVAETVARAVEMASPLLEKRRQHIRINVTKGWFVDADPTRLAQVFANLLTNASNYSPLSSLIEVTATATAERVQVAVRDEGVGISAELRPRLFEMFVQGERTFDRAGGGLGIGLTIAKSLCELQGGTIDVASDGHGKGSTFTVTLPRAAQQPAATPAPATQPVMLRAGTRILVVDDNIDAAQMLHELLATVGHMTAVAHDGPSALELARTFKPEIAVLDIGLPVMNGYELARRLREVFGAEVRLIAVTGYGQESDRARAREVGFDHHLIKPIEFETLLSLLAR